METYIMPTPEQFKKVLELNDEYKGPILMINFLKFKPNTGEKMYQKYGQEGAPTFNRLGVKPIFRAPVALPVIGPEEWDEMLIVRYPSIANFIEMNRDKSYQEAVKNRTQALIDSRLYLIKEGEAQTVELR
ncbi:MAG: DUF1330 domain-containing protein [Deltaproteobacteria bacterium]|nr:DUF1330 domain-containing protein [Deltaproteobacteria bacterium]